MRKRMARRCATFLLALAVLAAMVPVAALAETYQHGYLRYEVVDQSVTITGYAGREETVTVPAMIAGNPVNTIANGAFLDAYTVEAVYLPDTVTSVEQGAFAPGQAVVLGGGPALGGGHEDDGTDDGSSVDDGVAAGQQVSGSVDDSSVDGDGSNDEDADGGVLGLRADDGSLVAVDDEGHLVLVDASGTERVLDDSRTYRRTSHEDGTLAIVDDAGGEVVVADGSKVSFSDAEGRQVVVDAALGVTTVADEGGSYGHEEVEVGDEVPDASQSDRQGAEGSLIAPVAVAAAAAAATIVWRRKKQ